MKRKYRQPIQSGIEPGQRRLDHAFVAGQKMSLVPAPQPNCEQCKDHGP